MSFSQKVGVSKGRSNRSMTGIVFKKLPEEVLLYHIFRFLNPIELFGVLQRVNTVFQKYVWKSMKNFHIFDEKILMRKDDYLYIYEDSPPHKLYKAEEDDEEVILGMKEKRKKKNYICPSFYYFLDLCHHGSVNLKDCGMRIFKYIIDLLETCSETTTWDLEDYGSFYCGIIDVLHFLIDFFFQTGIEIENQNIKIEKSYFHRAYDISCIRLINVYLYHRDKFRLPNTGHELRRYFHPTITAYAYNSLDELFLTIIKNPYLFSQFFLVGDPKIAQLVFNDYVDIFRRSACYCCDGPSTHISDFLEAFNDMYITHFYSSESSSQGNSENNNIIIETKKLVPSDTKPRIILKMKKIEHILSGKDGNQSVFSFQYTDRKLREIVRFIQHFGVFREEEKRESGGDDDEEIITTLFNRKIEGIELDELIQKLERKIELAENQNEVGDNAGGFYSNDHSKEIMEERVENWENKVGSGSSVLKVSTTSSSSKSSIGGRGSGFGRVKKKNKRKQNLKRKKKNKQHISRIMKHGGCHHNN